MPKNLENYNFDPNFKMMIMDHPKEFLRHNIMILNFNWPMWNSTLPVKSQHLSVKPKFVPPNLEIFVINKKMSSKNYKNFYEGPLGS